MPARDANLAFRASSAGALTAAEALTAVQVNGTLPNGLSLQVNVPITPTGTSPILTVNVYHDTDVSTNCTSDDELLATKTITAVGEYIIPLMTPKRSVMVKLDISGTSPSFGAVEVYGVLNVAQPWTRGVEFHT